MLALRLLIGALLVAAACSAPPRETGTCALDATPEQIAVEDPGPGELHEVHDLVDTPALWAAPRPDAFQRSYRARAAARVDDLRPRALLRRQHAVYGRTAGDLDAMNIERVLAGAGRIAPANCLELRLLERQSRRYDLFDHPTELGAFVLRSGRRVRVYVSSADRVGQRIRSEVTDRVAADVAHGFVLVAHVHNHTFLFDRRPGDRLWTSERTVDDIGGGLAPSATDVQLYRSLRIDLALQQAWVTNGIDSGHFDAADFDALASR